MLPDDKTLDDIEEAQEVSVSTPGASKMTDSSLLWVEVCEGGKERKFCVNATERNRLLYDRERYTYDGKSLYTILFKDRDKRAVLNKSPFIAVKPGPHVDTYRLWFKDRISSVLTMPEQSSCVLEAICDYLDTQQLSGLEEVYKDTVENYVDRDAIHSLIISDFDKSRLDMNTDGLTIDDIFLLTWDSKFYLYTEDWTNGAFTPQGEQKEKPSEFVSLSFDCPSKKNIEINGVRYELSSLEHEFVRKLQWILNWKKNIDDAKVASIERTVPIIQQIEENR
jgi:hypothetical protein